MSVPLIDLRGFTAGDNMEQTQAEALKLEAVAAIHNACREWGLFQVINHGIPDETLDKVRGVVRSLFDVTVEEMQACQATPEGKLQGYMSRKVAGTNGFFRDYVDAFFSFFHPQNMLKTSQWPPRMTQHLDLMQDYSNQLLNLADTILSILSTQLGLPPTYIRAQFGVGTLSMRFNNYPAVQEDADIKFLAPRGGVALTSHSDPGGITLLLQDDVAGLQVEHDGEWVDVPALPSAIVINVADQVQVLSNGIYQSVHHRAVVPVPSKARISLGAFVSPSHDSLISPAKELIDELHPPLYNGMTYGEYFRNVSSSGPQGKGYLKDVAAQQEGEHFPNSEVQAKTIEQLV